MRKFIVLLAVLASMLVMMPANAATSSSTSDKVISCRDRVRSGYTDDIKAGGIVGLIDKKTYHGYGAVHYSWCHVTPGRDYVKVRSATVQIRTKSDGLKCNFLDNNYKWTDARPHFYDEGSVRFRKARVRLGCDKDGNKVVTRTTKYTDSATPKLYNYSDGAPKARLNFKVEYPSGIGSYDGYGVVMLVLGSRK